MLSRMFSKTPDNSLQWTLGESDELQSERQAYLFLKYQTSARSKQQTSVNLSGYSKDHSLPIPNATVAHIILISSLLHFFCTNARLPGSILPW